VRGRSARWLVFLGLLALNSLVLGSLSRYAVVNKVGGLALLVLSCHAVFIVVRRAGPDLVPRLLRAMVNVTAVTAAIGIAVLVWRGSVRLPLGIRVNPYDPRVSGLMVDPNAFGALVAVCLVICVVNWRSDDRPRPWLAWARLVTLGTALVMSYSRTAWIAAGFGLLVWYASSSTRTRLRLGAGIGALAVVAMWRGLTLPLDPALAGRQFTIDQRTEGALSALADFGRSPVFGIGVGNHVAENSFIVHNTYMWVLSELGIVGLAVFAFAVYGVVTSLWSIDRAHRVVQRTLVCALAVMAVTALGIEALYQRHLWLLFGLTYAAASFPLAPVEAPADGARVLARARPVARRRAGLVRAHDRGLR
jgi:hypothetical protein